MLSTHFPGVSLTLLDEPTKVVGRLEYRCGKIARPQLFDGSISQSGEKRSICLLERACTTASQNANGALLELTPTFRATRFQLTQDLRQAVGLDLQHVSMASHRFKLSRESLQLALQFFDFLTTSCQDSAQLAFELRMCLLDALLPRDMALRLVLELLVALGYQRVDPAQFRSVFARHVLECFQSISTNLIECLTEGGVVAAKPLKLGFLGLPNLFEILCRFLMNAREALQLLLTGGLCLVKCVAVGCQSSEPLLLIGEPGLVVGTLSGEPLGEACLDLAHSRREGGGFVQESLVSLVGSGACRRELALDAFASGGLLRQTRVELRPPLVRLPRGHRALSEPPALRRS